MVASAVAAVGMLAASHAETVSACDALVVPSIGLERCVVAGGQAQIDAGSAVRVDDLSTDVVHWIAGHRTSHGGTFGSLTSLSLGDLVAYRGGVYRIEEHVVVNRFTDVTGYEWVGSSRDALILQTSASGVYVHLWHAPLTAEPFIVAQSAGGATPPAATVSTTSPPQPQVVERTLDLRALRERAR